MFYVRVKAIISDPYTCEMFSLKSRQLKNLAISVRLEICDSDALRVPDNDGAEPVAQDPTLSVLRVRNHYDCL